jgi:hypothetical protein
MGPGCVLEDGSQIRPWDGAVTGPGRAETFELDFDSIAPRHQHAVRAFARDLVGEPLGDHPEIFERANETLMIGALDGDLDRASLVRVGMDRDVSSVFFSVGTKIDSKLSH